jgi:hypothetical protein
MGLQFHLALLNMAKDSLFQILVCGRGPADPKSRKNLQQNAFNGARRRVLPTANWQQRQEEHYINELCNLKPEVLISIAEF